LFPTDENNHEKLLMYFFNIGHHVPYHLTNFALEIQVVCAETKKRNIIRGYIGLIGIVRGSKLSLNFV